MNERSVPEILGWTDDPEWGWFQPGSAEPSFRDGPSPDDMLDWLDEHPTCHVEKLQRLDGMGWQVCLWRDPADYTYHYGPTLHAALEAAVRAVAEATP